MPVQTEPLSGSNFGALFLGLQLPFSGLNLSEFKLSAPRRTKKRAREYKMETKNTMLLMLLRPEQKNSRQESFRMTFDNL